MNRKRSCIHSVKTLAVAHCAARTACLCIVLAHCALRCATTPAELPEADLSGLNPTAEIHMPTQGALRLEDGVLANDGTGYPSVSIVPDFQASDLVIDADIEFSEKGAPGLVFRASAPEGIIQSMYVVALHAHGVTLWRLDELGWTRIETHMFAVEPDASHRLHARVVADKIAVAYDGKQLFTAKDTFLDGPGHAGVRAVEGPCRFRALRVSSLD